MKTHYNWAILGAARIANKFAEGLKPLPNARLYAIAARDAQRAEDFRARHGFHRAYGSYEDMLADPEVDIVYIATTNNLHYQHTTMCLAAGKAVLCEKPFALTAHQVSQMVALSHEKNLFLMEALWSRFLPSMIRLKEEINRGTIGNPLLLQCDFGFISPFNPDHRVYNPQLGGGSILDIGIYPIFTAVHLFGFPVETKVVSIAAPTGTDATTSIIFRHANGQISQLTSSFQALLGNEARVYGPNGKLMLHRQFHMPARLSFTANDGVEHTIPVHSEGNGYNYEAAEAMRCLDAGLIESPHLSHDFSLRLMQLLDEVVRQAAS